VLRTAEVTGDSRATLAHLCTFRTELCKYLGMCGGMIFGVGFFVNYIAFYMK